MIWELLNFFFYQSVMYIASYLDLVKGPLLYTMFPLFRDVTPLQWEGPLVCWCHLQVESNFNIPSPKFEITRIKKMVKTCIIFDVFWKGNKNLCRRDLSIDVIILCSPLSFLLLNRCWGFWFRSPIVTVILNILTADGDCTLKKKAFPFKSRLCTIKYL